MSNNNNNKEPSNQDLVNLIMDCHNKHEATLKLTIDGMKEDINIIKRETQTNTTKMTELEKSVEILKQDKLKNNVKISGLPNVKYDTVSFVYNLFNLLDIEHF